MSELEVLKLKNGTEEVKPLVALVYHRLTQLIDDPKGGAIVWYELVMKCRDKNHEFFGNTGDKLKDFQLVEPDGSVNGSIRNVVLSSAEGDGLDMSLVNPIAE